MAHHPLLTLQDPSPDRAAHDLRRRELELQLRLAVLDLMDHLDRSSFALELDGGHPPDAMYLLVGNAEQIPALLQSIAPIGDRPPPTDVHARRPDR